MTAATWVAITASAIGAATPLIYAALGELVTERAGVLNLGVEGMMLVGAITGFAVGVATGSLLLGYAAAALAGASMALLFALLTLSLQTNQVATGLALTLFGVGVSAFAGRGFVGMPIARLPQISIPVLTKLPVIGELLFHYDALVYLSVALCALIAWLLKATRIGLRLRAVGEAPAVAHALGEPVILIRPGGAVRRCDERNRRCLPVHGRDSNVGRGHERRARLDRARAGGLRHLETLACARGRVFVWRGDRPAAIRPGPRRAHPQ